MVDTKQSQGWVNVL